MLNIDVFYTKGDHVVRTMTALHLLEQQHIISCRYIEDTDHSVLPPQYAVMELRCAGKRIAFDLRDASFLTQHRALSYLESVDFYFERSHRDWSFRPEYCPHLHKIKPYGFDYLSTYPGNPAHQFKSSGNFLKDLAISLVKNSTVSNVRAFEGKADYKKDGIKIIFMTRLWDPGTINMKADLSPAGMAYQEYRFREREKINSERVELCKRLKEIYGPAFIGGIQSGHLASSLCPELILPLYMTMRSNYLRKMKAADICIGSAGLEKSIGWKTGEYVAAARAIVCEEPEYILPGNFGNGRNYLSYNSVDTCLAAVEKLYQDPDAIYSMKLENERYYQEYLRPDIQMLNALKQCGLSGLD